jgi:hypothetical protein
VERETSEDIKVGRVKTFDSAEQWIKDLNRDSDFASHGLVEAKSDRK